jgi:hypothetical protein
MVLNSRGLPSNLPSPRQSLTGQINPGKRFIGTLSSIHPPDPKDRVETEGVRFTPSNSLEGGSTDLPAKSPSSKISRQTLVRVSKEAHHTLTVYLALFLLLAPPGSSCASLMNCIVSSLPAGFVGLFLAVC